jgi:VWFA-related protein
MRILLPLALCCVLAAQQASRPPQPMTVAPPRESQPSQQQPQQPPKEPDQEGLGVTFPISVEEVVAQTVVFNRNGGYANNVRPEEFRLFDNGKEQNIKVQQEFTPISLVILIQANAHVEGLLPQVNKIGSLIGPQVIGAAGEAAVIAYDHRIRVLQDFTNDLSKVTAAIKTIKPGSESNRMIDAVEAGTRLLRNRPKGRRRIMLLIGETRDVGSEARARETAINLELANVVFYPVDMSRFITTLTAPPSISRPDPLPPSARGMPSSVPATPSTVQQMYGTNSRAEFVPLLMELFKDIKAIFVDNPAELFSKATGGTEFGFHSQRTLETAISEIGDQLHSEYTISYVPNNRDTAGFHEIIVEVDGHPEVNKVYTRPGYWLGAK